jgi:putative oxidoreductase
MILFSSRNFQPPTAASKLIAGSSKLFLIIASQNQRTMKKLFSWKYSDNATSFGLLVLRFAVGGLMIPHGFSKLKGFGKMIDDGKNGSPMGWVSPFDFLSAEISLGLVVFAEFFCACLIVIGLMTRLACIPAIINMGVAVFLAHQGRIFGDGEHGMLYLCGYMALLFTGPGKFSMDRLIGK